MEEEGPEPQELFEGAESAHHHSENGEHARRKETMRGAITASVLAVCAALASLASGHTANQAIMKQIQSSDKWSYYQSKSTKLNLYEATRLSAENQSKGTNLAAFDEKIKLYLKEEETINAEAKQLQEQAEKLFSQHEMLALAVALFQVGIVISSVSILVNNRALYWLSVVAGAIGLGLLIIGIAAY